MQAVWVVGLERQYGKDMDHKVLVLDLDGTLTNSQKKITQATKQRIISAFPADQYMILESKVCGMNVKQVENFVDYIDFEVNKCLLSVNPDLADEYVKILSAEYGDTVSIYRSEAFYIEIMPMNVDKATSLDKMLPIIGGTRENTICCGDSFNDISMVRYAGIGVAMGNAQQRLKDVADYITDTNDNDGLVRVIDKFILNAYN